MVKNQSETCAEITIRGIVQGVGFRPFVYHEAIKFGIRGTVRNNAGEVEIIALGDNVCAFVESIRQNRPPQSFIENVTIRSLTAASPAGGGVNDYRFADFSIVESEEGRRDTDLRFFSPDLALCENCRAEIFDPGGRRYRHYFNTCTCCGPRFSVLKAFPYDRANTSMDEFPMCIDCSAEYHSPENPRFHAETICCNNCGPILFYRRGDVIHKGDDAFSHALKDLPDGIAIKGIGGYHLACSPYNSGAVRRLRLLKAREEKPFALMFRDLASIAEVCEIKAEEKALLLSSARPIVLLKMKVRADGIFADELLNGAGGRCGCFLPYTPLQELLLASYPCLVMTSANISSSPIIRNESEISALTDRVLYHDREIVRSVEDSVLQISADKPSFIRRARGYTPLPVFIATAKNTGPTLLAMGGDLKAAFGLLKRNVFTLSQYIGDLENAQVYGVYENAIADFERLFAIQSEAIVCDAHPRYFSSRLAKKLANERGLLLYTVYHHHAHVASVMAEHGLSRALGVAFDGSGYGEDGNIWGGEFLLCDDERCRRVGHLENTEILGSDGAAREAVKTALCYLRLPGNPFADIDRSFGSEDRSLIEAALVNHVNTFTTSSMGRLFDAIAAILGVCYANSYEGECAILLQYRAEEEARNGTAPLDMRFTLNIINETCVWGCRDILEKCLSQRNGAALGFHLAICDMIEQMSLLVRDTEQINDIALSGGVFQNTFLAELVIKRLAARGFAVFSNEAVPPNDGGLALGQAYVGMLNWRTGGVKCALQCL